VKKGLLLAAIGLFVYVFSADFNRGWQDVQMRQRIIADWNQDNSSEQFHVSGIVNQEIHVVLHGAQSADSDKILNGLTPSRGLVDEF
jgi:hypothetical protein